jgi:Protein of unknown function (DUF3352)
MKKSLSLVLLIALSLGLVAFPNRTIAATTSLAALMPADTFLYTELRTSDLTTTVKALDGLLHKANIPSNLLGDFDRVLAQVLRRPATVEKDILPWLGDHIAGGVYLPDKALDAMFTHTRYPAKDTEPEVYLVGAVKDDAAADAFLKEMLAVAEKSGQKSKASEGKIGSDAATIYSDDKGNPVLAHWKGYFAFGGPSISRLLDTLRNKKPTLAADPSYQKISGTLKPDNVWMLYSRSPITVPGYILTLALLGPAIGGIFENIVADLNRTPVANPTATPTRTPTPTPAPMLFDLAGTIKTMGATGIGLRMDSKMLALDFAFNVEPDRLQHVFDILKVPAKVDLKTPARSISPKMADRISNKAVFVMLGSDLAQISRNGLTLGTALQKAVEIMDRRPTPPGAGIDAGYLQAEIGLKQYFDLDLDKDVLSWLGGDFGAYMVYDAKSDLKPSSSWPFDHVLLVETTDAAKTESAIAKVNMGLAKLSGSSPTQADNGMFTFQTSATGPGISYGLVKNTLVLSNGSGAKDAASVARGDGTLASDADWKEAIALLPASYQHFWYANMTRLADVFQKVNGQGPDSGAGQITALVSQFKSAVLFSTDLGGGSSLTTLALSLK